MARLTPVLLGKEAELLSGFIMSPFHCGPSSCPTVFIFPFRNPPKQTHFFIALLRKISGEWRWRGLGGGGGSRGTVFKQDEMKDDSLPC